MHLRRIDELFQFLLNRRLVIERLISEFLVEVLPTYTHCFGSPALEVVLRLRDYYEIWGYGVETRCNKQNVCSVPLNMFIFTESWVGHQRTGF